MTESDQLNLGQLGSRMYELREEKRELEARIKEITEEYDQLHDQLIAAMDKAGTTASRGTTWAASISEQEVPILENPDLFQAYCKENDALYLYERRISTKAWREERQAGIEIPGVRPFTKRTINLRKLPRT